MQPLKNTKHSGRAAFSKPVRYARQPAKTGVAAGSMEPSRIIKGRHVSYGSRHVRRQTATKCLDQVLLQGVLFSIIARRSHHQSVLGPTSGNSNALMPLESANYWHRVSEIGHSSQPSRELGGGSSRSLTSAIRTILPLPQACVSPPPPCRWQPGSCHDSRWTICF